MHMVQDKCNGACNRNVAQNVRHGGNWSLLDVIIPNSIAQFINNSNNHINGQGILIADVNNTIADVGLVL